MYYNGNFDQGAANGVGRYYGRDDPQAAANGFGAYFTQQPPPLPMEGLGCAYYGDPATAGAAGAGAGAAAVVWLLLRGTGGYVAGRAMAPATSERAAWGLVGALLGMVSGPLGLGMMGVLALKGRAS